MTYLKSWHIILPSGSGRWYLIFYLLCKSTKEMHVMFVCVFKERESLQREREKEIYKKFKLFEWERHFQTSNSTMRERGGRERGRERLRTKWQVHVVVKCIQYKYDMAWKILIEFPVHLNHCHTVSSEMLTEFSSNLLKTEPYMYKSLILRVLHLNSVHMFQHWI